MRRRGGEETVGGWVGKHGGIGVRGWDIGSLGYSLMRVWLIWEDSTRWASLRRYMLGIVPSNRSLVQGGG